MFIGNSRHSAHPGGTTPVKHSARHGRNDRALLWKGCFYKPVALEVAPVHQTTNAGLALLAAADRRCGLTERLAASLRDWRAPKRVKHSLRDQMRQRVYGLEAGYEDANDAAQVGADPMFRLVLGRALANTDQPLASQPTLSRFENRLGRASLMRWGLALLNFVLERQKRRHPQGGAITLDLDPTDDTVHGQQLFSEYNGYYDSRCFLPLLVFGTWHGPQGAEEPERYLLGALLRPGNASASVGFLAVLRRVVGRLRELYGRAKLRVRLDGAYATEEVLTWLEKKGLAYVINQPKNPVLERRVEDLMIRARLAATLSGQSERVFGETVYQASTWSRERRVVMKAEATIDPAAPEKGLRDNPRFVVTNLRGRPEEVYRYNYCPRGAMEKEIGELKNRLALGRTSCGEFLANQVRVLLTATAYALLQELRTQAARTAAARWEASNYLARLVKCAAVLEETTRRWVLRIAEGFPDLALFLKLARRLGAQPSG